MTEIRTTRTIETITGEIKALQTNTLACAIEIGRRLVEAKEMLPHGEWGKWLVSEVDFSHSQANNLMKLFEEYGSPQNALFGAELNSQTFGNLSYSKALKLLAVPAEEREEFVKENPVDDMSTRELEKAIAERDAAKTAEVKAKEKMDKLRAAADKREARIKELEADIKALEEKADTAPAVTVEGLTQDEVDAAVEEAKLQAAKEKQAELDALRFELETTKKAASMSDPVTTEFKVIFSEVQEKLGRLLELAADAGENSEKLMAALGKMLEAFGEKVG